MRLHHTGFIVRDIDEYQKKMLFEEKLKEVIDPVQMARLALYRNFSESMIELIQPLNENSFTWNSLQKQGNHFAHFCYIVSNIGELEMIVHKYNLIHVLEPVPAPLFNDRLVTFYYNRNKQIVEFLIDS